MIDGVQGRAWSRGTADETCRNSRGWFLHHPCCSWASQISAAVLCLSSSSSIARGYRDEHNLRKYSGYDRSRRKKSCIEELTCLSSMQFLKNVAGARFSTWSPSPANYLTVKWCRQTELAHRMQLGFFRCCGREFGMEQAMRPACSYAQLPGTC